MKGAQARVLLPFSPATLNGYLPYDLANRFAGAFARYPYVESFFVSTNPGTPKASTLVFNRTDRPPPWDRPLVTDERYPVLLRRDPAAAAPLVASLGAQASLGARFVTFATSIGSETYHTVVHLLYAGDDRRVHAAVGFTVSLDWVRRHYFNAFIREIQEITAERSLNVEIVDDGGAVVAATGASSRGPVSSRTFRLVFADPSAARPARTRSSAWPRSSRSSHSYWRSRPRARQPRSQHSKPSSSRLSVTR
jgi:hypothetical protein